MKIIVTVLLLIILLYAYLLLNNDIQETVNILDFGADPTGIKDSTAAFIIAAAPNRKIIVPPGIYLFNSQQPAPYTYFDNPCLLYSNLNNFTVYAKDAIFNVGDNAAFSSIVHFDKCSDIIWIGGTMNGNKYGQQHGQENVAMTFTNCINVYCSDIWIRSGFGGNGAGICGDCIVNGVFENIKMDNVGIATDLAFLLNVSFRNIVATGSDFYGNVGGGHSGNKGFSLIYDTPFEGKNTTGYDLSMSKNVLYENCNMSNFNAGAAISSGTQITFKNCIFNNNIGNTVSVPGIGIYLYYNNGGMFTSVGRAVSSVNISGCSFIENGYVGVGGAGILIDASNSVSDNIDGIVIDNCVFDNNVNSGIGGSNSRLINVLCKNSTFSGPNQTKAIKNESVNV